MQTSLNDLKLKAPRILTVSLFCLLAANPATGQQDWELGARQELDQGQLELARRRAEDAVQNPVSAAAAYDLLGQIALRERRYEEAISNFDSARGKGRFTAEAARDWSTALANLGRYQEASELLESFISGEPSRSDLRYRLAGMYLAHGMPRKAWPHLEEAYRQGLRHAGVVLELAQARFAVGRDDQAVELLKSINETASSPDILLEAGKLLFDHVLYRQAQIPLEKAWQQEPYSYEAGMYLALSRYLTEQYAESADVLQAIRPGTLPSVDYLILRGSVFARLGRWEESRRELEKVINQAPDRAEGYLNLGLFFLERGQKQQSMEMLEKGSRMMVKGTKLIYSIQARKSCEGLAPPGPLQHRDSVRGQFYSQLAQALYASEHGNSALEVFLLALELDNLSSAAYAGIGKICWELDSFKVAQAFLERGLELNPGVSDLHFNLGLIYQSLGLNEDAVRCYKKAIELRGSETPALHWVQLGTAQLGSTKMGEQEAEASFLKALQIDPNSGEAHYQLGKVRFQQKDYTKAEEALERAVSLDPSLTKAYYHYGMACLRLGKTEKGKELLETFNGKRTLRAAAGQGMQAESISEKVLK
jgi:tetratricopeptide (TPR) repeat protein